MNQYTNQDLINFIMAAFLSAPRFIGIFYALPMFSHDFFSKTSRGVYITALGFVIFPLLLSEFQKGSVSIFTFGAIFLKEIIVGFCMGFVVAAPSGAMRGAGSLFDTAQGSSMPSTNDPTSGSMRGTFESLFQQFFIVIFFETGTWLLLLTAIYASFIMWSPIEWWPVFDIDNSPWVLKKMDELMKIVVLFVGPILLASFLLDIGLALLSLFIPQLQVFLLSMGIKSGIVVLMLFIYLPIFLQTIVGYMNQSFDQVMRAFDLIG